MTNKMKREGHTFEELGEDAPCNHVYLEAIFKAFCRGDINNLIIGYKSEDGTPEGEYGQFSAYENIDIRDEILNNLTANHKNYRK